MAANALSEYQLLCNALMNLLDPELGVFVAHLKDLYPQIPNSEINGKSRVKITQVMLQNNRTNAISDTCKILRKMRKNDLADQLQEDQESSTSEDTDQSSDFQLLHDALMDLVDSEMEMFVLFLKAKFPKINNAEVQDQTRDKVVQVMLQFDRANAISTTCDILRTMGKKYLADNLQEAQDSRTSEDPDQREQSEREALAQNRIYEDQLNSSTSEMASTSTVAEGAFGKVYKEKYNGQDTAMKKVPLNKLQLRDLQREYKIYKEANHPNIVKILGNFMIDDCNCTIRMEWISGEVLETTIFNQQKSKIQLTPPVRHTIIVGMCEGLEYLHSKDIVHQDLKPDNIMVEHGTNRAVIIDLGLAKFYKSGLNSALNRGNLAYAAPEVRQWGRQRSQCSDVWAMGKIMAELCLMTNQLRSEPVCSTTIIQLLKSSSYCRVVCAMVEPDPAKRATMAEVIKDLGLMEDFGRISGRKKNECKPIDQESSTSESLNLC